MKCKTEFRKPTKYAVYSGLVSLFESRILHQYSRVRSYHSETLLFYYSYHKDEAAFQMLLKKGEFIKERNHGP